MTSNLDRYNRDLDSLIAKGRQLYRAMLAEFLPEQFRDMLNKKFGNDNKKVEEFVTALPSFEDTYQPWYSEAKSLIRQLLPDRLSDFERHYEKPKHRKDITFENYRIEDCLQGLAVTRGLKKEKIVGPDAAITQFRQQIAILESARARFASSLFDIRQLVQADLLDSELDAAEELCEAQVHACRRGHCWSSSRTSSCTGVRQSRRQACEESSRHF